MRRDNDARPPSRTAEFSLRFSTSSAASPDRCATPLQFKIEQLDHDHVWGQP